ncbi:uncharacterized protein LOC135471615 isoform X1 [Liolophura sinensis]|uniref:uncharacterized protein LOC135471615 isoform X1 n=1 Tax=Liolophura sinensis TaxID=3198878 RepID=UPI0031582646
MEHLSSLSSWSRYDVGQYRPSSTDHWAKNRTKALLGLEPRSQTFIRQIRPVPTSFDELVAGGLKMSQNGLPQPARQSLRLSREKTRTSFNERAKSGFQYWLIDRPKPTSFGKYGMGSYKTVLGIGNAPRT